MTDDLLNKVERAISTHQLLRPGEKCVVAVSGGIDSMVLLHLLYQLKPKYSWALSVAHFNHQLRKEDSDLDKEFVAKTCKSLGLEFHSGLGEVENFAAKEGLSIEMAARQLRYSYLFSVVKDTGGTKLALAHHADDQLETFFLKLVRGTPGEGLAGMRFARTMQPSGVTIIRPLLGCSKVELKTWAALNQIAYREDSTNNVNFYLRNQLRNKVLPELKDFFPQLPAAVEKWQTVLGEEKRFIIDLAQRWIQDENRLPFEQTAIAMQREIIHQQMICRGIPATFDLIETLRLKPGILIQVNLSLMVRRIETGAIEAVQVQNEQFLADSSSYVPGYLPTHVQVGDFPHKRLSFYWVGPEEFHSFPCQPGIEFFDAREIGARFKLRRWQPGDRFQPIGMKFSVKIQDLFTNAKIPRGIRHKLLIAEAADGRIFWVEKLRIGEHFKVGPGSQLLLKWHLSECKQIDEPIPNKQGCH